MKMCRASNVFIKLNHVGDTIQGRQLLISEHMRCIKMWTLRTKKKINHKEKETKLIKTNLFVNTAIETSKKSRTLTFLSTVNEVKQRSGMFDKQARRLCLLSVGYNKKKYAMNVRIFIIRSTYYDDPQQANHIFMGWHDRMWYAHFIQHRRVSSKRSVFKITHQTFY